SGSPTGSPGQESPCLPRRPPVACVRSRPSNASAVTSCSGHLPRSVSATESSRLQIGLSCVVAHAFATVLKGAPVHLSRPKTQLGAALAMSAALVVMTAGTAFAHEARDVGQFKVEVGWATEPAYTGDPNAIQFILHDANDQPITDLGDTLKVEASFGDKKSGPLDIKPAFSDEEGTKGDYRSDLVPTRPGKYTFHFT